MVLFAPALGTDAVASIADKLFSDKPFIMITQDATSLLVHHGGMNVEHFDSDHHNDSEMLEFPNTYWCSLPYLSVVLATVSPSYQCNQLSF
jgi:hypothetical protein